MPESSADIRARVVRARETQLVRFGSEGERIYANAQMGSREIRKYCELGTDSEHLLERAMRSRGSARAPTTAFSRSRARWPTLPEPSPSNQDTLRKQSSIERWTARSGRELGSLVIGSPRQLSAKDGESV